MNFVEFNNFVGKVLEIMDNNGGIENFSTDFVDNSEFKNMELNLDMNFVNCLVSIRFLDYKDKINNDFDSFHCYICEIKGTDEVETRFDNKEQLLSHLSTMSIINQLFN